MKKTNLILLSLTVLLFISCKKGTHKKQLKEDVISIQTADSVVDFDGFKELQAIEVPKTVFQAISKDYPNITIKKVYINKTKQYKLEGFFEDTAAPTELYTDAQGNWLKKY